MASELTIDYTLNYKVSIDVDKMKETFPEVIEEFEMDDDAIEEWIRDSVMASLEDWEQLKLEECLPSYVTHFSVSERST